jgi:hypothetical protein
MRKLVGITGRAGAGKDTLAAYFVAQGYVQYSLASPIKAALNAMFGFTNEQWEDRQWKETVLPVIGKNPRQMAQTLGTDWGRQQVSSDLWLQLAHSFIINSDKPVVISDVRFDNEADFVQSLGGEVIRVVRHDLPQVQDHLSETGVSSKYVDWTILNNTSIESMHSKISRIFPMSVYDPPKVQSSLDPDQLSGFGHLTNLEMYTMVQAWLWSTSEQRLALARKYNLSKPELDNYVQRYKQAVRNGRPHHGF